MQLVRKCLTPPDIGAAVRGAWSRCWKPTSNGTGRGGGAGRGGSGRKRGGQESESLLEGGFGTSDGSRKPGGKGWLDFSSIAASLSGLFAGLGGSSKKSGDGARGARGAGGSSSGGGGAFADVETGQGSPGKSPAEARSKASSPGAPPSPSDAKRKLALPPPPPGGGSPSKKKNILLGDSAKDAKRNICSRAIHSCLLALRSKTGKNWDVANKFKFWRDICHKANETKRKKRKALHSLVYRQERMAFHGWLETVEMKKAMLLKLRKGLATLTRTAERKAFNSWHEQYTTLKAKMEQIERVLKRASPEGKAKLRVIYELRDQLYRAQAMRKALTGFTNHAYIAAFNKWIEVIKEQGAKNAKIKAALARMSPEGRAMLKVFEKLQEIQRAAYAMRRAVSRFTMAGPLKAFNSWKTLQSRKIAGQQSTVWLAAQRGHRVGALQEMLEALPREEADELIKATDETGMTPLLWSAKRGFADVVEVLLAFGADASHCITAGDVDGATALHHAARKGHNEIAALLINAGAPVNAVNLDHSTPLHWAARKNNTGAIKILLDAQADPEIKNKWGATALDNAKFADHMGSIALLATDAATRKAAETKLMLERKLRPTEEERAAKLAELASDALARREANKERLQGIAQTKEAAEAATKERAQQERRQRNADRALAAALSPIKTGGKGGSGAPPPGALPAEPAAGSSDIDALVQAILEAKEAGNAGLKGQAAERIRAAEVRLAQMKAENAGVPMTPGGINSHRTPGSAAAKESPIERTLRRQKLAAMKR